MRSTDGARAGFTLLETLIAFSVFSLFLIAVHKSFVFGLKAEASSEWSDSVGQAVRSEFALVEAGLQPAESYERELWSDVSLKVEIDVLPVPDGNVPMTFDAMRVVRIRVLETGKDPILAFQKIVFQEPK